MMKVSLNPLDKLFSQYIRMRAMSRVHGCERCGAWKADYKQLQCAHLISRWHKSTRWDEDAAVGLCGGCHLWIDHEAEEKLELLKSIIGEDKVLLLKARARTPARYLDKEAIRLYLMNQLEVING